MTKTAIQVIDRAAALLDALGRAGGDASLKVLSAETGLHPSTASRILASLMAHGLVERGEGSGRFRLGVRLLQLAARVGRQLDVRREAPPIMEWLRDKLSHIKMPRSLDFHPNLPRMDNGKLYKRHLVEEYRSGKRENGSP
jgi:DNA-binding transcriptional ArsR family regulator